MMHINWQKDDPKKRKKREREQKKKKEIAQPLEKLKMEKGKILNLARICY